MNLEESVLELLRQASTELPRDVTEALVKAESEEEPGSSAQKVFQTILENIELAAKHSTPICQDTGSIIFSIHYPYGGDERVYRAAIEKAVIRATEKQYLRPNSVDPVTSINTGNNIGENNPFITFHQWDSSDIKIELMLKGGGCENVGDQYKLPNAALKAGRDLDGVRKVIIDAITNAQGLGCAPGIVGVGIGGDRVTSYMLSKNLFFRKVGTRHSDSGLADLETKLKDDLNTLQIGPMGFGGKTSVLDVFLETQNRHPASFFVSISYMCWAFRRKSMTISGSEVTYD